jgi:DHA1 family solute carrier family 18 vesicular amine transporter 1/2
MGFYTTCIIVFILEHCYTTYMFINLHIFSLRFRMMTFERIDIMRGSNTLTAIVVGLSIFTDVFAYGILIPLLHFILEKLNRNEDDLGYLFGTFAAGSLFSTPIVGIISDRYKSRKTPMLIGILAFGVSTLLLAVSSSFYVLLILRAIQGIGSAVTWIVGLAMVADVYPSTEVASAMGPIMVQIRLVIF